MVPVRGFPDSSLSMIFQCRYVYQYLTISPGDTLRVSGTVRYS
nr:MAG TPA: bacterial OB fold protein [Caudoviricetes sp.]